MLDVILSVLCSFALTLFLGWLLIPALHRLKAGQTIRGEGPQWHQVKNGTPTMGGLMFIGGCFCA